jgi:hypothetical protein
MNHQKRTINAIPLELWKSILLYAIWGIVELSDLSLVSKEFRSIFFTEKWMSIIAHRNSYKLLKQFLPFIHHNEEYFQDYVISRTYTFLSQYRYCISGAFTLAVILGNDVGKEGWNVAEVEIYISMSAQEFSKKRFSQSVRHWWKEIKPYFNYTKGNLKFVSKTNINVWMPTIILNHYMMALVTFTIIGHDQDHGRRFHFFILNSRYYHEPTLFCQSRSEFTFLCNYITVDSDTSCTPKTHVEFPTAVIAKVGPYNCWYLTEWELEWLLWVKEQYHPNGKIRKYYIERRKLIPSVQENRLFYSSLGFIISGFIPRKHFFFGKDPFM